MPDVEAFLTSELKSCQQSTRRWIDKANKLEDVAKAGYKLSAWAASINWKSGDNTAEWLEDLQSLIVEVQHFAKKAELELPEGAMGG